MNQPSAKTIWERLNNSVLVRFLLLCASGWALVQVLAYFQTVIAICTSAALLAFLLSYPVGALRRFLPHSVAAILVFFVGLALIGGLTLTAGLAVLSQGQQLFESLTSFLNSLVPLVERIEEFLRSRNVQVDLNAIEENVRDQFISGLGLGLSYSLATLQLFFANLLNLVLISVISLFMLLDGEKLWIFVLKIFPRYLRDRVTAIVQRNFLGFFRGQFILTLFLTTCTFLVFLILQVPFPLVLSLIAGLFDTIPGIGATLGVGIIFVILLSQNGWLALKVLVACIILQQIQDNLISPRVMQNSVNVNPVVIFFALLVGARVAGILGIFIAIPIAGVLVDLLEIDEMKGEG